MYQSRETKPQSRLGTAAIALVSVQGSHSTPKRYRGSHNAVNPALLLRNLYEKLSGSTFLENLFKKCLSITKYSTKLIFSASQSLKTRFT